MYALGLCACPRNSDQAMNIPFNRPHLNDRALAYIDEAIKSNHWHGDGQFTKRCQAWIEKKLACRRALLTSSGTAALEMAAILADIQPGDEIIMPSFTFVSTANAFVLRGAIPVFVDIDPGTQNIHPDAVAEAVNKKTKAIVPVHYAGVGCDMGTILEIARSHDLVVIEDAAQAFMGKHDERFLGSFGHMAAFSFHGSKNVAAGEGGALILNDPRFEERAEMVREKGTNRTQFMEGTVDKYTWVDLGSSYLPSEITAAFLLAQLEAAEETTTERQKLWGLYHVRLEALEESKAVIRPMVPENCTHNGHLYYLLVRDKKTRTDLIDFLSKKGITAAFHFVPLHDSDMGRKATRTSGNLPHTIRAGACLVRLPLWPGMRESDLDEVVSAIETFFAFPTENSKNVQ